MQEISRTKDRPQLMLVSGGRDRRGQEDRYRDSLTEGLWHYAQNLSILEPLGRNSTRRANRRYALLLREFLGLCDKLPLPWDDVPDVAYEHWVDGYLLMCRSEPMYQLMAEEVVAIMREAYRKTKAKPRITSVKTRQAA